MEPTDWNIPTPTTICRTIACGKFVHVVEGKHCFYCYDHLRCGHSIILNDLPHPCEGCLKTFQEDEGLFHKG